jgi:hypothetical protein
MITRAQAELARASLSGVFDANGDEVTVLSISPSGIYAVVENRTGGKRTRMLSTLDPSRGLLALEQRENTSTN